MAGGFLAEVTLFWQKPPAIAVAPIRSAQQIVATVQGP
jgi:hypothetical protein